MYLNSAVCGDEQVTQNNLVNSETISSPAILPCTTEDTDIEKTRKDSKVKG